jgi:hypothetical protein
LGESSKPIKRRGFSWALKQLARGAFIARHAFELEPHPKRLAYHIETDHDIEMLFLEKEHDVIPFAGFSYADITAFDWYLVEQLELTK